MSTSRIKQQPGKIAPREFIEHKRDMAAFDDYASGWREAEMYHLPAIVRGDLWLRIFHAAILFGFGLWAGLLIGNCFG